MTTLAERLLGVVRPGGSDKQDAPYAAGRPGPVDPALADGVADTLGGDWHDAQGHRYLVVERRYAPGHRHGRVVMMNSLPPWPQFSIMGGPQAAALRDAGSRPLLFLDLETTGLAGGAGTYAFLVGLAWFDGAVFRTRQYFLSSYTAERALLAGVAEETAAAAALVTYNGKSFDVPLMDTRFVLHRMATPFAGLPHVDMLHPARRLWRSDEEEGDGGGCRLTTLEETLCGHRREGDVPGFEIPSRYFHYVRTGDARPLAAVFEHNRLDLLALALITAQASQLLDDGPAAARTAREALGLGCLYERAGLIGEACACYLRAEDLRGDVTTRADALRAYAVLSRRGRRHEDAASAWRRVLALQPCPPAIAREATEALAVHHEHRVRNLREARRFAVQSLQFKISMSRQQAVQHRLARLDRKLREPPRESLF
jgi:uncharacterized protein YprB with RNaseH-like and TPR domain